MSMRTLGRTLGIFGSMLVAGAFVAPAAEASRTNGPAHPTSGHATQHVAHAATSAPVGRHAAGRQQVAGHQGGAFHGRFATRGAHGRVRLAAAHTGISCVPFARNESGIGLSGNAATWWEHADGRYARGETPEPNSILSFRANYAMHLGHVAVVTQVINNRQVEIDHANWAGPGAGRGRVSRNISVVDVSPNNDWTAVRVALGHTNDYGSVYPTNGFIYDRPDTATQVASSTVAINPPPRDLRPAGERTPLAVVHPVAVPAQGYDEVAEAPAGHAPTLMQDAPIRDLR